MCTPTGSSTASSTATPTATPAVSVDPSTTLRIGFNRANSTNLGANWTERAGDLQIYSNTLRNVGSSYTDNIATWNGGSYGNVFASAKVQFSSLNGTLLVGVRWGSYSGGVPNAGYAAEILENGQVKLWRISDWAQLGSYTISGLQAGQWVNLGLRANGSALSVEVDGVTRITATNSSFTTGEVGLWSYEPTAANQHVFDDFLVQNLGQGSLLGVHVKASLVKAAYHEKAFRKAQTLQAPPTGQVWKSYYFQGATRLALRVQVNGVGDKVYYLLTDQLGSTAITVNVNGSKEAEIRYKPWGETRYMDGNTPTDYLYTGQREEIGIGLYFYQSRFYDANLGRFVSADTIIPGGVQGPDRYAAMRNNPLKYIDPSGHDVCDEDGNCYRKGEKYHPKIRTGKAPVFLNPVEPMEKGYGYDFGDEHKSGIDLNPDNSKNPNPNVVTSSYGEVYSSTACTTNPCKGKSPDTNDGYGNVVIIGYDYVTLPTLIQVQIPDDATLFILYAHLDAPSSLKEGDRVAPGQLIGQVGNTGDSSGVHMHMEIRIEASKEFPREDIHTNVGTESRYTEAHYIWHNYMKILNPYRIFTIR
jgi:RHS repeat-associated protein